MGILTRRQGDGFVITSDRATGALRTNRAPHRLGETYEVWTGTCWSAAKDEAVSFTTLEAADDYVRANFALVNG